MDKKSFNQGAPHVAANIPRKTCIARVIVCGVYRPAPDPKQLRLASITAKAPQSLTPNYVKGLVHFPYEKTSDPAPKTNSSETTYRLFCLSRTRREWSKRTLGLTAGFEQLANVGRRGDKKIENSPS